MAARVSAIAPPGSLLKGSAPPRKQKLDLGRKPRQHDGAHLEAIRQCPCLACGADVGIEAAHVRFSVPERPNPGTGNKPNDSETVPLCGPCHREQHKGNEGAFWARRRINPLKVAAALYRLSPNLEALRAAVFAARAVASME